MANQPLLTGIEPGTGSVTVVFTSIDGQVLGQCAADCWIDRPAPGGAEQHPHAWWRGAAEATGASLSDAAHTSPGGTEASDRILAIELSGPGDGESTPLPTSSMKAGSACGRRSDRDVVGLQPTFCATLGRAHGGATGWPVRVELDATRRMLARVGLQRPSS